MLTPYDEFPVHQASRPFSHVPSTDYNWDDGHYIGIFSPDAKVFLACGLRVNPNADMVGGYAMLNVEGQQFTVRFSRCWRREVSMRVGPFRIEVLEPLRRLRVVLDKNASPLHFDFTWEGASPAFLEEHHVAENRSRRTTDQSRYSQPGWASGFIQKHDRRWEVNPGSWSASRDHSWGLYAERPPLGPLANWLPPTQRVGPARAMRYWTCFRADALSGFYHMHEDSEGVQRKLDDVFGTPFGGQISLGWDQPSIALVSGTREFEYQPGTRILKRARMILTDEHGKTWRQDFETVSPPWLGVTLGYTPGSWKDGGTFHTYHGSEELALEWDEFDFSSQPMRYTPYGAGGAAARDTFGMGLDYSQPVYGGEYLMKIRTQAPDGSIHEGAGQVEHFVNGRYRPYGFE